MLHRREGYLINAANEVSFSMYCPRCGQQQVSGELRFCARCGFPLVGVGELLAHGGLLPAASDEESSPRSPQYKGVRQGTILLMVGALLVPLLAIIYDNQRGD